MGGWAGVWVRRLKRGPSPFAIGVCCQSLVCQLQRLITAPTATLLCPAPAATKLDADSLEAIAGDAPSATLPLDQLVGASLADVMVAVGMQPSKAAVRRMIKVGGIVEWAG